MLVSGRADSLPIIDERMTGIWINRDRGGNLVLSSKERKDNI